MADMILISLFRMPCGEISLFLTNGFGKATASDQSPKPKTVEGW